MCLHEHCVRILIGKLAQREDVSRILERPAARGPMCLEMLENPFMNCVRSRRRAPADPLGRAAKLDRLRLSRKSRTPEAQHLDDTTLLGQHGPIDVKPTSVDRISPGP